MAAIKSDHREADLQPGDRAMLDFAAKLTLAPAEVVRSDLEVLRRHGFDDNGIHDIVQVAGLFAYFNRMADGLGIDLEPDMPAPPAAGGD
ncbi:MAG: hypothetical protein ACE5GX_06065 [Thermoanaerobaculia bacterium]